MAAAWRDAPTSTDQIVAGSNAATPTARAKFGAEDPANRERDDEGHADREALEDPEVGRALRGRAAVSHVRLAHRCHARRAAVDEVGKVERPDRALRARLDEVGECEAEGLPRHQWFAAVYVGQRAQQPDAEEGQHLVDRLDLP